MLAQCKHQHGCLVLLASRDFCFHASLAYTGDLRSSMVVSCPLCFVLAHGSLVIGGRMSCLSLLNLTGCHVPGLCWQSADVPLVSASCGKLVFVNLS